MVDIGRVLVLAKGEYDEETEYEVQDVVYDTEGAYLCIQDCSGVGTYDEEYWRKIVDLSAINSLIAEMQAQIEDLEERVSALEG